jgi:hypothetical protein
VQVKGLVAGSSGQALDHLSVICPWVLTSPGGGERQQKMLLGMVPAELRASGAGIGDGSVPTRHVVALEPSYHTGRVEWMTMASRYNIDEGPASRMTGSLGAGRASGRGRLPPTWRSGQQLERAGMARTDDSEVAVVEGGDPSSAETLGEPDH